MDAEPALEMACVLTRKRGWKNSNVSLIALNFKNHYFPLNQQCLQGQDSVIAMPCITELNQVEISVGFKSRCYKTDRKMFIACRVKYWNLTMLSLLSPY
jgi:hypothetical protein